MESHKEDNDEDSKKTDWCMIFMLFRSRGFTDNEILQLSYPKFKAYLENINNPLFFNMMIPYLGTSDDKENNKVEVSEKNAIKSKDELLSIVASMNSEFR